MGAMQTPVLVLMNNPPPISIFTKKSRPDTDEAPAPKPTEKEAA